MESTIGSVPAQSSILQIFDGCLIARSYSLKVPLHCEERNRRVSVNVVIIDEYGSHNSKCILARYAVAPRYGRISTVILSSDKHRIRYRKPPRPLKIILGVGLRNVDGETP